MTIGTEESDPRTTVEFGGLVIEHDADVLHPRPWTTLQSEWAAELLDVAPPGPVLELCAGAGQIGLLTARLSGRVVVAVDAAERCCRLTESNARRNGLVDLVEVRHTTVADAVRPGERFAAVIADPPWVRSAQVGVFPEDPTVAIDGGIDGLALARDCLTAAAGHLPAAGSLLVQVGEDRQADGLASEAADRGWRAAGRRHGEGGLVLRLRHP